MRDEMRRHLGKPVLVQLDTDQTVAGTLERVTAVTLTLTDATLIAVSPTPVDGDIVLSRVSVVWVQVA